MAASVDIGKGRHRTGNDCSHFECIALNESSSWPSFDAIAMSQVVLVVIALRDIRLCMHACIALQLVWHACIATCVISGDVVGRGVCAHA